MFRSLTPLGIRVIVGIVLIALFALILTVQSCNSSKTAKTEARLSENQAEAATASGTDAVESVGKQIEYERHVDYITKETQRVIFREPGAGSPLDPALDRVGRDRLCQRTAYREHPDCLQQVSP